MSSKGAVLALKITGDSKDAVRALDDVEGKSGRFDGAMGKLAAGAAVGIGAIGLLGKAAFDAASNLEQSTGAVTSVFGDWAIDMEQAAASAVDSVGLSKNAYQELAATVGAQLKNMGMSNGDAVDKTQDLIQTGADLAATFGGPTSDAVSALGSLLRGETDPIERYGISIKQADIDARLAADGMKGLTGEAEKQARANALLAMVTEQSGGALGAFGREADTAAGKQQRLSAWWENAKATLGEKLLPIFVTAATFMQEKVAPVVDRLIGQGGPLSTMFATVGAFISTQLIPAVSSLWNELAPKLVPIIETVGRVLQNFVIPAFMAIWGVVQQYVVPIFRSVLSPALEGVRSVFDAVEGALERNRSKFSGLLDNVRPLLNFLRDTVAPFIGGALKTGFEVLSTVIGKVVDAIAWVLDKASSVAGFIGDVGGFLFGGARPAAGGGAAPAGGGPLGAARGASPLFGASTPLLGASAGPGAAGQGLIRGGDTYVTVSVDGFVGSESQLADAIGRMLDDRARRIGAAPAFGGVRIA